MAKIRPKIGLALGSGGARGLAHIGVIKVLEQNKIPIDFIAGSSIGAMIGGFYAAGLKISEIEKIALTTDWHKIFSLLFEPNLKYGLIGGEKVKNFIESYINGKKFEECKIPFSAVATDLKTGETVVLNSGEMAPAIRASISIPLVFKPEKINNRILSDGGLSIPIPVEVVRNMGADLVIAVNLDKYCYEDRKPGWYNIANALLSILRYHLALSNVANADIVVNINIKKYPLWYHFVDVKNKILSGEKEMKKMLPKIRELINQKSKNI